MLLSPTQQFTSPLTCVSQPVLSILASQSMVQDQQRQPLLEVARNAEPQAPPQTY